MSRGPQAVTACLALVEQRTRVQACNLPVLLPPLDHMSRHSFSSQPHPNPIQRRTHSHSSPNLLNPTLSSDSPTFLNPNSNSSRLGWLHRSETLDLRSHTHTHSRSQSNPLDRHHSTASRLDRQASSSWRRGDHPSRLERERSDISFHWLFRSNIPRRRGQPFSNDAQRRNFFGMGEIIGVITNPAETVRSLTESRRLLNEARQEIEESRERAQLRPAHTFSRLPGFWDRPNEVKQIERALEGEPSFTVLFGASSVGKTALLREVLSRPTFHVLHFDLRIAGFADLGSLYTSLSQQMEMYFECVGRMRGYEVFEREGWGFKHDRLNVERRVSEAPADSENANVKVSDIARLMELFQSSLLKYWEHQPPPVEPPSDGEGEDQKPPPPKVEEEQGVTRQPSKTKWTGRVFGGMRRGSKDSGRPAEEGKNKGRVSEDVRRGEMGVGKEKTKEKRREKEKELPREPEPKKMPVIFFDEAHKLPALIRSTEAMKCLLDSMLVLTKQDRLCHVIHATSDPFYQTWLRQLNIMQHCKIITIGDCSKAETRAFFNDRILPRVPESMRRKLNFERLYDAFGGKLAHWHDYITDYVNRNGKLDVTQSSHFLQAHALLNLHVIHSSQLPSSQPQANGRGTPPPPLPSTGKGFKIYSPLTNPHAAPAPTSTSAPDLLDSTESPGFTAMQLLRVMSRFSQDDVRSVGYFPLCREFGARAVDGMVKGRILDLRWTEPVTTEGNFGDPEERERARLREREGVRVRERSGMVRNSEVVRESELIQDSAIQMGFPRHHLAAESSGTAIGVIESEEGDYVDVIVGEPEVIEQERGEERGMQQNHHVEQEEEEEILSPLTDYREDEVIGPKLVPTTPIMRFAMREVVQEYEDVQSVSEYASLSEPDEY